MFKEKVQRLLARKQELEELLGKADVFDDQKRYRDLTREHAYLNSVGEAYSEISKAKTELADNKELLSIEEDESYINELNSEIERLSSLLPLLETKLETLLVPPDPNDHRNIIVELRAGTGGDEAAIFVGDCVRMYKFFADKNSWTCEQLSCTESDAGGYKEYIMVISGTNVHRFMQFEAGTHRVQRVPVTETQGRVHTSAITVAVLLEPDEEEDITIDEKEIRIDTQRASGAGGQHVNTTDSAVRITHLPTNIVVYCQDEKSQHKNKDKAMRLLKAKILEAERIKAQKEIADKRSTQIGSGDRSERIRTYNFPQNRISDHRINLTLYKLDQAMQGNIQEVVSALVSHNHQVAMEA